MILDGLARTSLYALADGIASQLGNGWYLSEYDGQPVVTGKIGWLSFAFTQEHDLRVTLVAQEVTAPDPVIIPVAHIGPGLCAQVIKERLVHPTYARMRQQTSTSAAREWLTLWQAWFLEQAAHSKLSVRFTTGYDLGRVISLRVVFAEEKNADRWAAVTVFIDDHPARLEVSDHAHELQRLVTHWISGEQPNSPANHRAPRFRRFKRSQRG